MSQRYIVCVYGRIGYCIAEILQEANIPIVFIENKSSSIGLYNDTAILVGTNSRVDTKKARRGWADNLISSYYETGAGRTVNEIRAPADQFIDNIMVGANPDYVINEVKIFKGTDLTGKTLAEAKIKQKYFVVITVIIRGNKPDILFSPGRNDKIHVGDSLILHVISIALQYYAKIVLMTSVHSLMYFHT